MSDKKGMGCTMRRHRNFPKRERVQESAVVIDEETLKWLKTHTLEDLADLAIRVAAEGKDPTPAFKTLKDLAEMAWKTGAIKETPENLEALEYYIPEAAEA